MIVYLNWEGRGYTPEDYATDMRWLREVFPGPLRAASYDVGMLFADDHSSSRILRLRRGVVKYYGDMDADDDIARDEVIEWEKYQSVEDFVEAYDVPDDFGDDRHSAAARAALSQD